MGTVGLRPGLGEPSLAPVLPLAAVAVALGSQVGHGGWHHTSDFGLKPERVPSRP